MKGIMTLIASMLIHLINGSMYSWGNWSTYLVSFLKDYNPSITLVDGFFLMPIGIFFINCHMALGGYLENKYGIRVVISFGFLLIFLGYLILFLCRSLEIAFIALAIIGSGTGLNYMPPLRICWRLFPFKKGTITGIILCSLGVSPMFSNIFSTNYINPNNLNAEGEGSRKFFTEEITQNVPHFFLLFSLIVMTVGIVSLILLTMDSSNHKEILLEDLDKPLIDKHDNSSEMFLKALKSKQFFAILFMGMSATFFYFTIYNTNKTFGLVNNIPEYLLIYLVTFIHLANGLGRLILGTLYDFNSFKCLYKVLVSCEIFLAVSIFYTAKIPYLYFFWNLLCAFCMGGNLTLYPTLVQNIFGIKNSSELYGIMFVSFGFSGIFSALLSKYLIVDVQDYLSLYIIGGVFALFSLIISQFFLVEEKFDYCK